MNKDELIDKLIHMLYDADFKFIMLIYNFSLGLLNK